MKASRYILFAGIIFLLLAAISVKAEETFMSGGEAAGFEQSGRSPMVLAQAAKESVGTSGVKKALGDVTEEDLEEGKTESLSIADPLYPWNKAMYHFNDKFYFWLMKPVATGYKKVIPGDFRSLFGNFYKNLKAPISIINNMLQLKFERAGKEFARMAMNTTLGVGGLRDCANDCFGIRPYKEDLGQTFGFYGIGHGFYIVWPFLGPSSLRDTVGFAGDLFLSPTRYLEDEGVTFGLVAHENVNAVSFRIGDYEAIKEAAIDPYVAIRDGYLQNRKAAVDE